MLEELLINTRCDTAARYLVYSREPLAIHGRIFAWPDHQRLPPTVCRTFRPCTANYTFVLPMLLEAGRRR